MSDWYSEMIEQAHKNDPTARIAFLETALAESQLKLEGAERWNGIYQGEIAALKAECERLRKDAERYRWLRDVGDSTWRPLVERSRLAFPHVPESELAPMIDEIISAASAEGER